MKTKALLSVALLWTALGICPAAPGVSAVPAAPKRLDEIIPADTLLYVSIPDAAKAREALATTALADIWREPEVRDFVRGQLVPLVKGLVAGVSAQKALERGGSDDFDAFLGTLSGEDRRIGMRWLDLPGCLDGELSIAVTGVDPADKAAPVTAVAVLGPCRIPGTLSASLKRILDDMATDGGKPCSGAGWTGVAGRDPTGGNAEFGLGTGPGGRVIATVGPGGTFARFLEEFGKPAPATLAGHPDYRVLRERPAGRGGIACIYANLARVKETILASVTDPMARAVAPAMIEALGLSTVRAAGMSIAVKEKGFVRSTVLLAPGEKKGLLAAAAGDPGKKFKSLAFVPTGTHGFFAGRVDPKQVWRSVQDAVRAGAGEAGLFSMREEMAGNLPPEILRDLPVALGGEVGLSLKQQIGVMPIPEITLFVELADEAAARRLVDTLLARGAEEEGLKSQTVPGVAGGPAVTTVTIPDVPILPAFAIHKGWLVAGMTSTAVKAACRRIDAPPANGIASTDDFKAAFSRVAGPGSLMSYEEGPDSFRKQYNQIVAMFPMIQMGLEQAMGEIPFPDPATLPMADTIARHLFGSAQAVGADADCVYAESFGVLPASPTDVAGIGLVAALLLPAVARARDRAEMKRAEMFGEDDPLAAAFDREDAADASRLSPGEVSAARAVRATLETAAVGRKLVLFDVDGDGTGEYPSLDGKGWQGFVDAGGNFLLPFCETNGVAHGYRFSVRPGKDPEQTAYVLAVPVEPGKTGNRVFIGATDGALYQAKGAFSWKDGLASYLKEDGGPGHPPKPFVPVGE